MAKIGHRFQSLSIVFVCAVTRSWLHSFWTRALAPDIYGAHRLWVLSTLTFKCTVFNNGGGQIGKHCCRNIPWETMLPGLHTFGKHGQKTTLPALPTFGKYLLRNCSDSWFADLWEIFAGKQRFLAWLTHLWKIRLENNVLLVIASCFAGHLWET